MKDLRKISAFGAASIVGRRGLGNLMGFNKSTFNLLHITQNKGFSTLAVGIKMNLIDYLVSNKFSLGQSSEVKLKTTF